jgi:hypothetical protein
MDISIGHILQSFASAFVLPDSMKSAVVEMKKEKMEFAEKLNGDWTKILNIESLKEMIPKSVNPEFIKKELEIGQRFENLCYVISKNEEIGNKIMEFEYAFGKVTDAGGVALIINLKGNRIYFQTGEAVQKYFIGKSGAASC